MYANRPSVVPGNRRARRARPRESRRVRQSAPQSHNYVDSSINGSGLAEGGGLTQLPWSVKKNGLDPARSQTTNTEVPPRDRHLPNRPAHRTLDIF